MTFSKSDFFHICYLKHFGLHADLSSTCAVERAQTAQEVAHVRPGVRPLAREQAHAHVPLQRRLAEGVVNHGPEVRVLEQGQWRSPVSHKGSEAIQVPLTSVFFIWRNFRFLQYKLSRNLKLSSVILIATI